MAQVASAAPAMLSIFYAQSPRIDFTSLSDHTIEQIRRNEKFMLSCLKHLHVIAGPSNPWPVFYPSGQGLASLHS